MRIRFNEINIIEAYNVEVIIGGTPTDNNKYTEMTAHLFINSQAWPSERDLDYDKQFNFNDFGEFDVSDCHTFEEVEAITNRFFDDLLVNGYIDISTDEKCEKYRLVIY